jgi:hypothetical protein
MRKIVSFILKAGIITLLSACASIPSGTGSGTASSLSGNKSKSSSAADAEAAAQAALNAMNGGGGGQPTTSGSSTSTAAPQASEQNAPQVVQSSVQTTTVKTGQQPAWVASKDSVYNKTNYISAIGYGANQTDSDKRALSEITSQFGQSIQADMKTMSLYSEKLSKGTVEVEQNTSTQEAIRTSTQLDSLIGAEIGDRWFDAGKKTYYSIAIMDRAKTGTIYRDIINANLNTINSLLNMKNNTEKYSFDGYLRYQRAALIADANQAYANVLSVVGDTSNIRASLKQGKDYQNEAKTDIIPRIPIAVTVESVTPNVNSIRADNIKTAFSDAIKNKSFRTGGTDSRYVLKVSVSLEEVSFANNANKFSRITVNAFLHDKEAGNELIPYQLLNHREGHASLSEAEERCIRWAITNITGSDNDSFGKKLENYLTSLTE